MRLPTRQKVADLAERTAWTLLQAGTGEAVVQLFEIPQIYAVVIAGGLAALKGALAQKFSSTGTAATLPSDLDPVTTGRHAA